MSASSKNRLRKLRMVLVRA